MQLRTMLFATALLVALAVPTLAQTTVIPRYTVIPVVLDNGLNSAVSKVGDVFYSHCAGTDCGGFPVGTQFKGKVTGVVRASGTTPGQIDVQFTHAILPGGTVVPISGLLSSLNSNAVVTDPQTGRLTARTTSRNDRNKFIAYGAGAGILIGVLSRSNILKGALIGAAAGWLAGALQRGKPAGNVDVPPGTEFGIMLTNAVTVPTGGGAGPGTTEPPTSPETPTGWTVSLANQPPLRTPAGVLLVPFREVMDQINQPFTYRNVTKTVSLNTDRGLITHVAGTKIAYDNGAAIGLAAPSRIVNGTLYVPEDLITIVTGLTPTYQPSTRMLVIR